MVEEEAAVVEGVSVEAVEEIAEDEVEGLIEAEVGVVLTEAVVVLTEVAAVFEDSGDLLWWTAWLCVCYVYAYISFYDICWLNISNNFGVLLYIML